MAPQVGHGHLRGQPPQRHPTDGPCLLRASRPSLSRVEDSGNCTPGCFLDISLTGEPLTVAKDFYIISILEVTVTPGALIGILVGGWLLYKKGKN